MYDIECLVNFFCVCFKSGDDRRIFEISDRKNEYWELIQFLNQQVKGLKGYNNLAYDSQLIEWLFWNQKKVDPYDIYQFSQKVIDSEWAIYPEYKLQFPNLDIYKINHGDNKNRKLSLKHCEFMIDWHNIEDMPYHHNSPLTTEQQIEETISYCWNDVEATERLFELNKAEIELRVNLSQKYGINLMNASDAKIGSEITLKLYCDKTGRNLYETRKGRTERSYVNLRDILLPYIKFDSEAFSSVLEHFKKTVVNPNEKVDIGYSLHHRGLEYVYGLGGLHAAIPNTIIEPTEDELLISADVAGMYPSIIAANKLYPEHLGPEFAEVYGEDIVKVRLNEKAKGKAGDKTIIAGLKASGVCVFGKSNDRFSPFYDPALCYSITIGGQLSLSMLIEKLLEIEGLKVYAVNTDGVDSVVPKSKEEEYYKVCREWEKITKLQLEYVYYSRVLQRDINNYLSIYTDGKVKQKGDYEFENLPLHKNKSNLITRIAIYNWFVNGTPIEETVHRHDNILDFCIGSRVRQDAKFFYLDKQGVEHPLSKTIRYFISNKGVVIKKRFVDGRVSFMNVAERKGYTYYQTMLNKYEHTDAKRYDINYKYYIKKTNDELHEITNPQSKLF